MATYTTVQDVYDRVSYVLLEPSMAGAGPGLSLGIVTEAQFLQTFGTILLDFLNRTGLVWAIFTQQLNFGTTQYLYPTDISTVKSVFVGGVDMDHVALQDLDDWRYGWRSSTGVPEFWHQDGLAPKMIEVVPNPNYTGAGYAMTVGASPPYGVYGRFNGAPMGLVTGYADVAGTAVTWRAGDIFNTDWPSYYPGLNISIAGTDYPIESVESTTGLTLLIDGGTQSVAAFTVTVGQDGNLTVCGPKSIDSTTFTLGEIIPVIQDSFCPYLVYGILAKFFSMDGECKDGQRAAFCQARYQEGINLAAAVAGNLV